MTKCYCSNMQQSWSTQTYFLPLLLSFLLLLLLLSAFLCFLSPTVENICCLYFDVFNSTQSDNFPFYPLLTLLFHCVLYHIFFMHSSDDGYLGWLSIFAVVNNATLNMIVWVSLSHGMFRHLGVRLVDRIASKSSFQRKLPWFLTGASPIYHITSSVSVFPLLCIFASSHYSCLEDIGYLTRVKRCWAIFYVCWIFLFLVFRAIKVLCQLNNWLDFLLLSF